MLKFWHSFRVWLAEERLAPKPQQHPSPEFIAFRRRQELANLDDLGIGFPVKTQLR